MMLSHIKHFFEKQPIASLSQVAQAIDVDPTIVQRMLEHFERKGSLTCLSQPGIGCGSGAGSCEGCPTARCNQSSAASLLYQWVA